MGSPKMWPLPVVGVIKPKSILIVVVLPEPFGPTKPQTMPNGTSKLMCETAKRSSYFLDRSETEIAVFCMPLTLPQLAHE